jgi:hypothetical protein
MGGHRHLEPRAVREEVRPADRLIDRHQNGRYRRRASFRAKGQRFLPGNVRRAKHDGNCNQHSTYSDKCAHI